MGTTALLRHQRQSSYDPRDRKRWFGNRFRWKTGAPAWSVLELDDTEKDRLFRETAPINLLSSDAPPVFLSYMFEPVPLDLNAEMPDDHDWSHTPLFAVPLKTKADRLGVEMRIKLQGHWSKPENIVRQWRDYAAFISEILLPSEEEGERRSPRTNRPSRASKNWPHQLKR